MKLIHAADLHLGSPLSSISDDAKRTIRKNEILKSFEALVNYAKENDVKIIMLSGDVFDSDSPYKKDKDYFYRLIEKNKDITFLYLKGNHDISGKFEEEYENLLKFDDKWKTYVFDDLCITGVELNNANSKAIYPSLSLDKKKTNIVMMHGDVYSKGNNYISLKDLKDKGIDYLALGHIHENSIEKLDERGYYAYSGCLEGRGYDETGEKGFYLLNYDNGKIDAEFIKTSIRLIHQVDIDITNLTSFVLVKEKIEDKLKDINKEDIVRVNLIGDNQTSEDLDELKYYFSFFDFTVKDMSKRKINYLDYENDLSLKGEFVRGVLNNDKYSEDEKNEIIYLGLKALKGGVR